MLPVLQVGGQLGVLSLLCPLPGGVTLQAGGAAIRLRRGQGLPSASGGEGTASWARPAPPLLAQVSQG